jgi:N-terminal 7TM region of histidine kinase
MLDTLLLFFANLFAALNQILTAAIVITAASLLLYSLTFNLHNRVARSFAGLLAAVSAVFLGDVLASLTVQPSLIEIWLRFQWVGIAFLPPAYLHVSDALLETTGLPSRGRRRAAIKIAYLLAAGFVLLAAYSDWLVADPRIEGGARHLEPGPLFIVFTLAFILCSVIAWVNNYRAYMRCLTSDTRRRMSYLLVASITVPFSVFPYLLLVGGQSVSLHPFVFWFVSVTGNIVVGTMLVVMAYVVAFFGKAQPDRVIKSRLFQWLLRGPIVGSLVLASMVLVGRLTRSLGYDSTQTVQVTVIVVLLLLQFAITLVRIPLERRLFYGGSADRLDVRRLQMLEERLLTSGDTEQYLESIMAAVCDLLRVSSAFVASIDPDGAQIEARVGPDDPPAEAASLTQTILQENAADGLNELFVWGNYWVLPLHAHEEATGLARPNEVLGLLALRARAAEPNLNEDESQTLETLATRATAALEDRRLQRKVFATLDSLLTEVDKLQRLRAATLYTSTDALKPDVAIDLDLVQSVRDALNQYWGGPKLTGSPLLRMRVVEQALRDHDGNPANALRAVLHDAMERMKPEGQRKFTAEWILYNILELKFMQGQTVRQVAMKLAVSESDLYRKQKVAIQQVARTIVQMEQEMSDAKLDVDYPVSG